MKLCIARPQDEPGSDQERLAIVAMMAAIAVNIYR